jgi:hypothetical protein
MPRKRDWSTYKGVKHEEEGIVAGAGRDVAEKIRWKFEPGKVLVAKRLGGAHIEERSFVAALLWMTARGGLEAGRRFLSAVRAGHLGGGAGLGKAVAEPPHSKSSWRVGVSWMTQCLANGI